MTDETMDDPALDDPDYQATNATVPEQDVTGEPEITDEALTGRSGAPAATHVDLRG